MKKVLLLLALLAFTGTGYAQLFGKKELKKHESVPLYHYWRPVVDVDTATLKDKGENVNKWFLIEAYLTDGESVENLVEGKTLLPLMRLPVKQDLVGKTKFTGYLYTGKSLGNYSRMKKGFIKRSPKFISTQRGRLIRERNTEKYELWSESPIKVEGQLVDGKFIPVSKNITFETVDAKGNPVGEQ